MRFFRNMTQTEIGDELGVSQMQVSRLLTRILGTLRTGRGRLDREARSTRITPCACGTDRAHRSRPRARKSPQWPFWRPETRALSASEKKGEAHG